MDLENEIWKEYPILEENYNNFRLFFSNLGRAKSINSHCPEGRILKGSERLGYRIISTRLYKERSKAVVNKLEEYNLSVSLLGQEIRDLKKINDLDIEVVLNRIDDLKIKQAAIIQNRKKYIHKTDKARTIHLHVLVHRGVAELFLDKKENDEIVIHKDFVKTNNELSNLEWKTKEEALNRYKENPYYTNGEYKKQLRKPGYNKITSHKLEENQVLYIKEKLTQGKTLKELAKKFGVSDMQIHRIKTGECWSHVKTVKELKERNKKWQAT
jgi:hypothetical protein